MPSGKELLLGVAAGALALLGGFDTPLQVLLLFNLLDLASGLTKALIIGTLDSGACWKGALRKLMMWLVVAAAAGADRLTGQGDYARTITVTTFCATELVSILENAAMAGLPIPPALRQALAKLKGLSEMQFSSGGGKDGPPQKPGGGGVA